MLLFLSVQGAPAPTAGSEKSSTSKESGQSSAAAHNPETDKQHQKTPPPETAQTQTPPPPETKQTPKDSPPPPSREPEKKGKEGDEPQVSAQPVPSKNVRKESPPPPGPESSGGTDREGGGSAGKKNPPDESEEVVEKCNDPVDTCSIDGLSACLQISKTGNVSSYL